MWVKVPIFSKTSKLIFRPFPPADFWADRGLYEVTGYFNRPDYNTSPLSSTLPVVASTVGFVAFLLQVATTTKDFVQDAKDFPQEFRKLSEATKDFAIQVQRLNPSIQKIEQRYQVGRILPFHFVTDTCVEQSRHFEALHRSFS